MAKLAFCDYHNMVAILEKIEHNTVFHHLADFLEASHIRRITRGTTRISQSKFPLPGADETAFPSGDVRYGEAFPTNTRLDAGQDRKNIAKTSAMPHEALPREDAPNTKGMDQGEDLLVGDTVKDNDKSADKGSVSTYEMSHVLGSLGAAKYSS
nr:hypothetical protein [Tanacetum cinerariifolium]